MTTPTAAALDELERLAIAATDGPWDAHQTGYLFGGRPFDKPIVELVDGTHDDLAYIAAANPTVVRGLIAALRAATARAEEAEARAAAADDLTARQRESLSEQAIAALAAAQPDAGGGA